MSQVEFLLTVGKLDASLALLTTDDHHVIEFPTVLLPDDVKAGSIVKLAVSQTFEEERKQRELFREIQAKIMEKYGTQRPSPPVLKVVNVTQTSCVLAWDPLQLGSASLKSLVLYRQGVRSTVIPCPLKTNTTKISGLSVDTDYEFELKLTTTSGQLWSEKVKMHTHKMTDMSGITVCLGPLDPLLGISGAQVAQSLSQIGARPMQNKVAIDTTHFVTNDIENDDDPELIKAKNSNIPIVRPEWVRASEMERRIVGVRGFYLDADQGILKSYQFPPATEEAKALFAQLKAGETTESINRDKELPKPTEHSREAEGSKQSESSGDVKKENEESPRITEEDLKQAAEPPSSESLGQDVVGDSQMSAKSASREITESAIQESLEGGEEATRTDMNETDSGSQQENAPPIITKDKNADDAITEADVPAYEEVDSASNDEAHEKSVANPADVRENATLVERVETAEITDSPAEGLGETVYNDVDLEETSEPTETTEKAEAAGPTAGEPATQEDNAPQQPAEESEASQAVPGVEISTTNTELTERAAEAETTDALVEADRSDLVEPAETEEEVEATAEAAASDSNESESNATHSEVAELEEDDEGAAAKETTATKKTTKKNKNKKKNKKKK
ncbi:hypothetical protein HG536_0C03990 [Torulaspora globosa]|uniref:Chitin biosynthesis protein CHS5 n=1 Tax=Torulaspora globosa TaxID=48254 RepID=A0A7G3ZFE4_9SACH|nr:uncharacterized protein HG536_0C03990 [Torulaspora globosa]QLL32230.1 hypothetical protein HG536_0C03990 [Torulaspora globosa]